MHYLEPELALECRILDERFAVQRLARTEILESQALIRVISWWFAENCSLEITAASGFNMTLRT